ncbi:DNA primase large subunit-like isoform X2 [Apostichopus japonicus]|uniref:DNA primase large subunit-like isoform X2 n=1 Tax=Stichopus japonicus TaxID=307972 RepID=UPI003AB5FF99
MEVVKTKRVRQQNGNFKKNRQKRLSNDERNVEYNHRLQFYHTPPIENITLHEFEEMAVTRLKVLKQVENIGIKFVKGREEYRNVMEKELRKLMPIAIPKNHKVDDEYEERRRDHISHFILRLAYCRSEDLRRWFIAQELDLFRFRFLQENKTSITQFLRDNNLHYTPISMEEKTNLGDKFVKASYALTQATIEHIDFYKVPFTEALDLVKGRKVYIAKGYAYVPHNDLVSIVMSAFRAHLSHALALTARAVPSLEEDNRLLPMLSNISKQYLGEDYSNKNTKTGSIALEDIDNLAKTSYPLCMRQLHSALREDHHLKHGGRQQYGLFIKGLGLTMEQALKFWRMEFSKKMDGDKFEKQYAYNIRHNFGKEGKRVNYTPYSCMKIIMGTPPGAGDNHGCPFRHTDIKLLKQRLASYKVPTSGIEQIADLVKGYHYQLACTKYFELTHNLDKDEASTLSLQHPNQYFDASREILSGKQKDRDTWRVCENIWGFGEAKG